MSESEDTRAGTPERSEAARHFGRLLERLDHVQPKLARLAGEIAVERMLAGHVCVDLNRQAEDLIAPDANWIAKLRQSAVIGKPGESRPLILDGAGRLYLLRQWRDEQTVAKGILERMRMSPRDFDQKAFRTAWRKVFGKAVTEVDWQQVAVFAAVRNRFTVISGGPGTGKTRTIGGVLKLLRELQPDARVLLAAPTGKAAARLQEAVAAIPGAMRAEDNEAKTLHRLLGARPDGEFRHDAGRPVLADWVIVDEASMVDLTMMATLMRALPPDAALVLVGDKDQLASVETGAVLGDVCAALSANRFTTEFVSQLEQMTEMKLGAEAIDDHAVNAVVQLRMNYRQAGATEAWRLSELLNAGDVTAVAAFVPGSGMTGGLTLRATPAPGEMKAALRRWVEQHWPAPSHDAREMLERLAKVRVLSALRDGPLGVRQLNRWMEEILVELGCIQRAGDFYRGRPLLVMENDYTNRLFNGDVGVVMEQGDGMKAAFPDGATGVRWVELSRLPAHETVYAMTVHKSQGSECDDILLVLPDANHPLLTRELVYTGLTRARRSVELWVDSGGLEAACGRRAQRDTGLVDAIRLA